MSKMVLPGQPIDYLDTPVLAKENQRLLGKPIVMDRLRSDLSPLPTTVAREGYFDDRHLEYWLSGYRDVERVINATALEQKEAVRVLDFGGASGRTARHFKHWLPSAEIFLCDINPEHVNLTRRLFSDIVSFRNFASPSLPFENHFFDCVVGFSVFTHLDADDLGWLLELRRVTKPGGHIYVTVHDEATWTILPNIFLSALCFQNPDFKKFYDENPTLQEKVVHYYSSCADYNCNVFVPLQYLKTHWFPLFKGFSIKPLAHDHQTAVVLEVGGQ